MKIFIILTSFWVLALSQCMANTWECEFENDFSNLIIEPEFDQNSGYICDLKSNDKNPTEITNIEGQTNLGVSNSAVKYLQTSSKFTKITSAFCQKFKNLEYMHMEGNEIESIDEDSLRKCRNLKFFHLDTNNINEIPESLLSENSKLIKFGIVGNKLTSLPENFFKSQNKLEQLNLEFNEINFLPPTIFGPLMNLQNMDISNNKFQVLDPRWFVNLKKLTDLNLSSNKITEVPNGIFKSLRKLEKLGLYGNKMKILNPNSFEGLQNLKWLSLHQNEISELPPGVFVPLKNLETLFISNNKLSAVYSDIFGFHNNLTEIYLQYNKISAFDEEVFDNAVVEFLNMVQNLCYNDYVEYRIEIKSELHYRPRTEVQTIPTTEAVKSIVTTTTQPTIQSTSSACGKFMTAKGNIIGGTQITRGSFPWVAAIMKTNGEYFCGGTLVTNQKIVTAAHCIQDKGIRNPLLAREIVVLLGVHDLKQQHEVGRIQNSVQKIHMHDDWNPSIERFDADIAVLVLEEEVTFGRYIQPICLIDSDSDIKDIRTGVVVGFGKSEDLTKLHENIAKVIDTPIQDNAHCFLSNYNLARVSSNRTFCGGTGTGIGVCSGDSGGGIYVLFQGAYYLRGIVSASIIDFFSKYGCDVDNYSVFTDMLKFNDWVNAIETRY